MKQRRFRMIVMKRKRKSVLGGRCSDFEPSCIVCACYHHFDKYGYYPHSFVEASKYQNELEKQSERTTN